MIWSSAEAEILDMIAAHVDRRTDLAKRYKTTNETRAKIALSTELRLTESSLARLLKTVELGIPTGEETKPVSATSMKASQAAHTRWKRQRMAENHGGA